MISLKIDGVDVSVEEGKSVLEAARQVGIEIPTICAHEDLPPYGACRMCIVQIDGIRGYPTSCTTPAENGMVVRTKTEAVVALRGQILELMLSGHPSACLVCPHREACEKYRPHSAKAGRTTRCGFCSNRCACELRDLTFRITPTPELGVPTLYSKHNVERDDPFMDRDYNLCILCGRCWRICEKIHGQPAISIINRGRWARVGTSFHRSHVDSGCVFCGACIEICPTGSLSDRYGRWHDLPDEDVPSACELCPEGCSLRVLVKDKRVIATRMTGNNRDARLCALGRFAYVQMVNAPARLRHPKVKEGGEQISVDRDKTVAAAAQGLKKYAGESFAVIANESGTREARHLYEKFARDVVKGRIGCIRPGGGLHPEALERDILDGKIKAAIVTGDILTDDELAKIEYLVVVDFLPSAASLRADVLLPAAVLSEVGGTLRTSAGEVKAVSALTTPPGEAQPEWMIVRDLARAMGAPGFEYDSIDKVTAEIKDGPPPAPVAGSPRDNLKDLPTRYRGHLIADTVGALEAVGLPTMPRKPQPELTEGFLVLEKQEVVPNFHLLKIEARTVAQFAKPGQFAILMVKETSERVPYTLADWDPQDGTITVVVEEVGRSSREAAELKKGDRIAHVTGPLGLPFPVSNVGTVALGGGCYGIASIHPLARALKQAGNRVISVIEASNDFLFYMEDKLRAVSDELLCATKDGSRGTWGGVQEVFVNMVKGGTKVDMFVAIGCTFMMRMVSEATKPLSIPTYVALNPIMVDGTGMCGACRVSVAGKTKFACVDGPAFNGHDVDWDELFRRRGAYTTLEVDALLQAGRIERTRRRPTS
jgi:NAD(P)H-flavin reductase/ferredoxin